MGAIMGKSRTTLSEINVTPFVDVMLVLLVIFMVTAPLMQQGIEVDLPRTFSSGVEVNEDPLILVISAKAVISIGNQKIELSSLKDKLQAIFRTRKNKQIYIQADRHEGEIYMALVHDVFGHWTLSKGKIPQSEDVREAISQSIDTLVEAIREVLETTPPEILSDIMRSGITLAGGGALLKGLDTLLTDWLKVPVIVADDPLTAVARGTGVILENLDQHKDIFLEHDDDIS
jgi:biopolymer transport protein TolR